ncbi:endothelin-converting enzyme 1-like [Dermacentor variabilis]|uniref:endothelin-converting enzyme 1-like n=1 Tax=Dermacentor variabilis TaxID=34621 RepID=UPI003F5C3769
MDPGLKKESTERDYEVATPGSPSARSLKGPSDRCSTESTRRRTSTLEERSTSQFQINGARKEAAVCQKSPPPSSEETHMTSKPSPQKDSKESVKDSAEDAPRLDPRKPLPRRASLDQHVSKGDVVRTETPVRSLYGVASDDAASVENALSAKKVPPQATEVIAEQPQVDPREPLSKRASIDKSVSLGVVIPTEHPPHPPIEAITQTIDTNKDAIGETAQLIRGGVEDNAEVPSIDPRGPMSKRALIDQNICHGEVIPTKPAPHTPIRTEPATDVGYNDAAGVDIAEELLVDPREPLSKRASIDRSVSSGVVIPTKPVAHSPLRTISGKDILGAIEGTLQGIEDIAEMPYVDPREPLSQRALIDRRISLGMVVPTKPASHSPLKAIPTDHATVRQPSASAPKAYQRHYQEDAASRPLLGAALGVVALAVVMLSILAVRRVQSPMHTAPDVCDTDDCVQHARAILATLDASADPCVDFYAHVCGRGGEWTSGSRDTLSHTYRRDVMPALGDPQALLAGETIPPVATMTFTALRQCLDRGRTSEDETFVAFMRNRRIPWPLSAVTSGQSAVPSDVLDVLFDLAVNWRVALWFDITVSSAWAHDGVPAVIISERGDVPALRMEQLDELDDVAYDDVARKLSGFLSSGQVTLNGMALQELRRDEAAFRQVLLGGDHEDEPFDDLVLLSEVTAVFGNGASSAEWARLLKKHLNSAVNVSADTKLLIMNEPRFAKIGGLVYSMPSSRILNVVGWMFAYSYAWIVNADFDFLSPSTEGLAEYIQCFVAVQESFGTAQALSLYRSAFSPYERRGVNVTLNWTARALLGSVRTSPRIAKSTKTEAQSKIYSLASSRQLWPPEPNLQGGTLDSICANCSRGAKNFFETWLESRKALRATLATPYYDSLMLSRYRWPSGSVLYLYSSNELRLSLTALFPPSYRRRGSAAMTYAGLGFNLARQALRSVDLRGRALDAAGRNASWWQPGKPGESPCRLDVAESVAERRWVADLFALDVALAAMELSSEGNPNKRPLRLKSLESLTASQTFYISYCSHYCAELDGRRRCNLAMNASQFSTSFDCHPEQPTPQTCVFL